MTQIIVLALDGEAILMKNILVTPSMQIQDKDQSGQASSTANAEQGVKGKELRVSPPNLFRARPVATASRCPLSRRFAPA